MICRSCGSEVADGAQTCPNCGASLSTPAANPGQQEQKDWLVALLLSVFVGGFGVDRFYLGYVGLGVLKLLTGGLCGVWWLIDVILIAMDKLPDAEGRPLARK